MAGMYACDPLGSLPRRVMEQFRVDATSMTTAL